MNARNKAKWQRYSLRRHVGDIDVLVYGHDEHFSPCRAYYRASCLQGCVEHAAMAALARGSGSGWAILKAYYHLSAAIMAAVSQGLEGRRRCGTCATCMKAAPSGRREGCIARRTHEAKPLADRVLTEDALVAQLESCRLEGDADPPLYLLRKMLVLSSVTLKLVDADVLINARLQESPDHAKLCSRVAATSKHRGIYAVAGRDAALVVWRAIRDRCILEDTRIHVDVAVDANVTGPTNAAALQALADLVQRPAEPPHVERGKICLMDLCKFFGFDYTIFYQLVKLLPDMEIEKFNCGKKKRRLASGDVVVPYLYSLLYRVPRESCVRAIALVLKYMRTDLACLQQFLQGPRAAELQAKWQDEASVPDDAEPAEAAEAASSSSSSGSSDAAMPLQASDARGTEHEATEEADDAGPAAPVEQVISQSDAVLQELSTLLQITTPKIRVSPTGLVSLIDIVMVFTGANNNAASEAVRSFFAVPHDLHDRIVKFQFPGRGQRSIHAAPLSVALEFALLLPGEHAAGLRGKVEARLAAHREAGLEATPDVADEPSPPAVAPAAGEPCPAAALDSESEQSDDVSESIQPDLTPNCLPIIGIIMQDFNGIVVHSRDSDGYFYATGMCQAFNKELRRYLKRNDTLIYLDALAQQELQNPKRQNCLLDLNAVRTSLVQVQHGGAYRGSWVHERVAIDLARWLSPPLAIAMQACLQQQTLPTPESTPLTANAEEESDGAPADAPTPSVVARTFQGVLIECRADGCLNATAMCKAAKKRLNDYLSNATTQEFLDALATQLCNPETLDNVCSSSKTGIPVLEISEVRTSEASNNLRGSTTGIPVVEHGAVRSSLVQIQNGGTRRGTWIHPLVAVNLAQWASPVFAVWVSKWVMQTAMPAQSSQSSSSINVDILPTQMSQSSCRLRASCAASLAAAEPDIPRAPRLALKVHEMPLELDTPPTQHDLYLMLVCETTASEELHWFWKIGRGHDPTDRETECDSEVRRKGKRWKHEAVCIWRRGGALEKPVHAEFTCLEGFNEYFEGDDDFPQRVQAAVELVLPKVLEKQHQRKRKALEELKRGEDAAAFDREIKRRKLTLELDREAASIANANADAKVREAEARVREADADLLRSLARDDTAARAVFLQLVSRSLAV